MLARGKATMVVDGIHARFYVSSIRELQRVAVLSGEKAILSRVLRELRAGDTIYDIGANIGTHSVAFAKQIGDSGAVVAFEPEPGAAGRLTRNVDLNGLSNVQIMGFALGGAEFTATLYVDGVDGSGKHRMTASAGWPTQEVRIAAGDDLVGAGSIPAPNVIKIDVEGEELGVLAGLKSALAEPDCRLVLCEVHRDMLEEKGHDPSEVEETLRAAGFTRFENSRRGFEDHLIAWKESSPG
jgi:FkbM family methyltransferase